MHQRHVAPLHNHRGPEAIPLRERIYPFGRRFMSKKIAFLSAAAFGALALTASFVAPVSAQDKMMKSEMSGEKTVMVGGAPMYPSKNIVKMAVTAKDHTWLINE